MKRCGNNNKDEDNCSKTLNDKNLDEAVCVSLDEISLGKDLNLSLYT